MWSASASDFPVVI